MFTMLIFWVPFHIE